jgi:hypothetical protein
MLGFVKNSNTQFIYITRSPTECTDVAGCLKASVNGNQIASYDRSYVNYDQQNIIVLKLNGSGVNQMVKWNFVSGQTEVLYDVKDASTFSK